MIIETWKPKSGSIRACSRIANSGGGSEFVVEVLWFDESGERQYTIIY